MGGSDQAACSETRTPAIADVLGPLATLRPQAKADLAMVEVAAGRPLDWAVFDRRGFTLSPGERADLVQFERDGLATTVAARFPSADGTVRLLLALRDGRRVEAVAMPAGTVCVSSQVGCAVGCRFCASGIGGVERHLSTEEIFEQVVHARREMPISRVVFMGMGEPSHNLDTVLDTVDRIVGIACISARRQTVSTVGSCRAFELMAAAQSKPCLALSLHTVDDELRRSLLPNAHREPVANLLQGAARYVGLQGVPLQLEWTLLRNVNDGIADADALCDALDAVPGRMRVFVNLIQWNPVADLRFERSPRERAVAMVRKVRARGYPAAIRDSAGQDVGAACGQLRREATD